MSKVAGLVCVRDIGFPSPIRQYGLDRVHLLGRSASKLFLALGCSRERSAGPAALSSTRNASVSSFACFGRHVSRPRSFENATSVAQYAREAHPSCGRDRDPSLDWHTNAQDGRRTQRSRPAQIRVTASYDLRGTCSLVGHSQAILMPHPVPM